MQLQSVAQALLAHSKEEDGARTEKEKGKSKDYVGSEMPTHLGATSPLRLCSTLTACALPCADRPCAALRPVPTGAVHPPVHARVHPSWNDEPPEALLHADRVSAALWPVALQEQSTRLSTLEFTRDRKMMSVLVKAQDGQRTVWSKVGPSARGGVALSKRG